MGHTPAPSTASASAADIDACTRDDHGRSFTRRHRPSTRSTPHRASTRAVTTGCRFRGLVLPCWSDCVTHAARTTIPTPSPQRQMQMCALRWCVAPRHSARRCRTQDARPQRDVDRRRGVARESRPFPPANACVVRLRPQEHGVSLFHRVSEDDRQVAEARVVATIRRRRIRALSRLVPISSAYRLAATTTTTQGPHCRSPCPQEWPCNWSS